MNRYICDADDFYVNVNLNTEMELPNNRDTVLHFFEQMKKGFPELRNFYTRENGDLVLEGDKEQDSYRWLAIEPRRLCSGQMNPETLDEAFRQHEMVLDLAPPLLDDQPARLRGAGPHVRLRLQFRRQPRRGRGRGPGGRPRHGGALRPAPAQVINYEPSITLALDESCQLQCRLAVETRTNAYQVRTREYQRRADQRLFHRAAILGDRPRARASSIRCGASGKSARRSSSSR